MYCSAIINPNPGIPKKPITNAFTKFRDNVNPKYLPHQFNPISNTMPIIIFSILLKINLPAPFIAIAVIKIIAKLKRHIPIIL
jgi:hypothetical protein